MKSSTWMLRLGADHHGRVIYQFKENWYRRSGIEDYFKYGSKIGWSTKTFYEIHPCISPYGPTCGC